MHRCPGFLARHTLVTLKKIERLRIISIIFICGFPGPNANNSQAPQFANEEEPPVAWPMRAAMRLMPAELASRERVEDLAKLLRLKIILTFLLHPKSQGFFICKIF